MEFYNPKMSVLKLGVSLKKRTIQLTMARSLNPNFQGRPTKGQRMYDWDNAVFFSLTPNECYQVYNVMDLIKSKKYVNPMARDQRDRNSFSLVHFRNNEPSRLILAPTQQGEGLALTIIPPKSTGAGYVTYLLRPDEYPIFKSFVYNGFTRLPYDAAVEDVKQWQDQRQQNQQNQQQQQYQQTYTGATFDAGVPPEDMAGDNYHFGFESSNPGPVYQNQPTPQQPQQPPPQQPMPQQQPAAPQQPQQPQGSDPFPVQEMPWDGIFEGTNKS